MAGSMVTGMDMDMGMMIIFGCYCNLCLAPQKEGLGSKKLSVWL